VTVNSADPNADLNPNGARRTASNSRLCGHPRRITFSRFNVDSLRADAIGRGKNATREHALFPQAIRGAIKLQLAVSRQAGVADRYRAIMSARSTSRGDSAPETSAGHNARVSCRRFRRNRLSRERASAWHSPEGGREGEAALRDFPGGKLSQRRSMHSGLIAAVTPTTR